MTRDPKDVPGVIAPPPLIFALPLVLGLLANRGFPLPIMHQRYATIVGVTLTVLAILFDVFAAVQFWRARTSMLPYQPTKAIIQSGPYRVTRNPLYVSMTVLYIGISLFANTVWPLLLLPLVLLVVQRGVIEREERYLTRKFGDEYVSYMSRVRRWL